MVDADSIIQTGIKAKTLQVPAEFVRSGGRPIVARHIPAAGMGGETVSRHAGRQGYGCIFRIDGKNISAAPDVGTVVSNVKRQIADYFYAVSSRILFQLMPLAKKFVLNKLPEQNGNRQAAAITAQYFRPAESRPFFPFVPGFPAEVFL